ncbi:MAG: PAS domain-containing sensor histidine kinase [Cyanobacteria bacterium P01_G01_bin.54]
MNGLWFIIGGLVLGLAGCAWQHYQLRRRIEQLTHLLPGGFGTASALKPIYRLRRGLEELASSQQQIEAQKAFWQSLLELAPLGYLQVDQDNYLRWCNPAARELLRIDRWQVGQSRLLLEVVRSDELDQLIEQTRQSQQSQQQDWVYRLTEFAPPETLSPPANPRPPQIYQIALTSNTIALPEQEVGVFLQDRQPLVAAIEACDRTFSDLTHELRTPLTAIRLVAETLELRLSGPEQGWVRQMVQELDRLMGLVEDCLELSQLSHDPEQILNREQQLLRPQLESVWQTLQPLAAPKNVVWHYQETPPALSVYGDPRRLIQAWFNLIDNAIKHSPQGAEIVIKATENIEHTCISIIDCGPGFQATELDSVFERLYRGDPSRVRPVVPPSEAQPTAPEQTRLEPTRNGSGLGLTITQQIIHAHGGEITAQNHPQTQGAWLQVKLPRFH